MSGRAAPTAPILTLRILSGSDVKGLATMREAIEMQKEAFALQAGGDSVPGLRRWLHMREPSPECLVGFLPALLTRGRGFGGSCRT